MIKVWILSSSFPEPYCNGNQSYNELFVISRYLELLFVTAPILYLFVTSLAGLYIIKRIIEPAVVLNWGFAKFFSKGQM